MLQIGLGWVFVFFVFFRGGGGVVLMSAIKHVHLTAELFNAILIWPGLY